MGQIRQIGGVSVLAVLLIVSDGCDICHDRFVYQLRQGYVRFTRAFLKVLHVLHVQVQGVLITCLPFLRQVLWSFDFHTNYYTSLWTIKIYYSLSYKLWDKIADKFNKSLTVERMLEACYG